MPKMQGHKMDDEFKSERQSYKIQKDSPLEPTWISTLAIDILLFRVTFNFCIKNPGAPKNAFVLFG